jgi:lipoprotein signal peptidase
MKRSKPLALSLVMTAGAVVLVDQTTKAIVRAVMTVCPDMPLAPCDRIAIFGPLGILRTDNGASAFGLSGTSSVIPLVALALVLLAAQARMAKPARLLVVGLGLQVGGLAANVADRLLYGAVTDFIHLQIGLLGQGPVGNPADVALVIGGAAATVALYRAVGPTSGRPDRSSSAVS